MGDEAAEGSPFFDSETAASTTARRVLEQGCVVEPSRKRIRRGKCE